MVSRLLKVKEAVNNVHSTNLSSLQWNLDFITYRSRLVIRQSALLPCEIVRNFSSTLPGELEKCKSLPFQT